MEVISHQHVGMHAPVELISRLEEHPQECFGCAHTFEQIPSVVSDVAYARYPRLITWCIAPGIQCEGGGPSRKGGGIRGLIMKKPTKHGQTPSDRPTPGAYRVFFHYGPDEMEGKKRVPILTIVAITPHP